MCVCKCVYVYVCVIYSPNNALDDGILFLGVVELLALLLVALLLLLFVAVGAPIGLAPFAIAVGTEFSLLGANFIVLPGFRGG